jgi:hypothetical protein
VGIYARMVEEHNHSTKELHDWLTDTLEAAPQVIEGNRQKIILRR